MATVTGLTAARELEIENNTVVSGTVIGDDLILTKHGGSTVNAGSVRGPGGDNTAPKPYARVGQEVHQSIPSDVATAIAFDWEVEDNDNIFDLAHPSRLTCRTPGIYVISAQFLFGSSTAGSYREADLYKNGLEYVGSVNHPPTYGSPQLNPSAVVELEADDYIELIISHNAGSAIFSDVRFDQPKLSMVKVAAPTSPPMLEAEVADNDYRKFVASLAPRSYYPCDEDSDALLIRDWMGFNFPDEETERDLTDLPSGLAFQVTGPPVGKWALDFTDADAGVMESACPLAGLNNNFTIFAWVRIPDNSSGGDFVYLGDGTGHTSVGLGWGETNDGDFGVRLVGLVEGGAWVDSTFDLTPLSWTPVAFVQNSGVTEVWAYGKRQGFQSGISISALTNKTTIGSRQAQPGSPARVAHVALFDRILTAQEHIQLSRWRP